MACTTEPCPTWLVSSICDESIANEPLKKATEIAEKMTRTMFSTNKYDKVRENKSMITKLRDFHTFFLFTYFCHFPAGPPGPGSMLGDRRSKLLPCAGDVVLQDGAP